MPAHGQSSNINFTSLQIQRMVHFANWHGEQVRRCGSFYWVFPPFRQCPPSLCPNGCVPPLPSERRQEMRLLNRFCVLILGLAVPLAMSSVVRADAVTDWNAIAVQTIVNAGPTHGSAIGFLDNATVQVAVYDAVEAITGRFRPYHVHIPGASGSPDAAVAAAAHHMLVKRFPSLATSLDTTYHTYLTSHGLSETDPGVAVGEAAADGIFALRATDGSFPDCSAMPPPPLCRFVGSTDIGVWRPTPSFLPGPPPSNSPMLAPWLSVVTPFTLTSNSQFRAVPPPVLTSRRYAAAYNEVKSL